MVAGSFDVDMMIRKFPITGGMMHSNIMPSGLPISFSDRKATPAQAASEQESSANSIENISRRFIVSLTLFEIRIPYRYIPNTVYHFVANSASFFKKS